MDGERGQPDDLSVQLQWPERTLDEGQDPEGEPTRRPDRPKSAKARETASPEPSVAERGRRGVQPRKAAPAERFYEQIEADIASLRTSVAHLEETVRGRLTDLSSRLDDLEAVMAEPLPVDISGLLRVLESKLFVPLDEMADSLASRRGGDEDSSLDQIVSRLEKAATTMERTSASRPPSTSENSLEEVLHRLAELNQQFEALRKRVALRARPESNQIEPQVIAAIADEVAKRLAAPDEERPPRPNPSASEEPPGPPTRPGPGSPRRIRLR